MNNSVQIGGLVSFTTIDYPGKLAAVIFFYGCPFRCKYCSNPNLLEYKEGEYDPEKILGWLKERIGKLEAVVFCGGEPLLQGDALIEYAKKVKEMGFFLGLHTNGFYTDRIEKILPYVDWLVLDIKTNKDNYEKLTSCKGAYENVWKSAELIAKSGKDSEVRITCDPRFITNEIICEIADKVSKLGIKGFAIQKYKPHFDEGDYKTTESERSQFFNNSKLKEHLESLFDILDLREG